MMKRRTVKAILCAALMALTLSLTACGGSDDASKDADAAVEENAEPEEAAPKEEAAEPEEEKAAEEEAKAPNEEETAPEEEGESAGSQTLEEYFNSTPGAMEALEEQLAGAGDDNGSVSGEVKENDFTFNFTLKDASAITDDLSAQLEAGLDASASVFQQVAAMLDEEIGQKGAVAVIVRYLDPDGNVLAERSFKAE